MSLAPEIKAAIKAAVAEALAEASVENQSAHASVCACGLESGQAREMGHFMGMVKDLGDGSTSRGVETMRKSMQFVPRLMSLRDKIGNLVLSAVIAVVTGGLLALVWDALRSHLGGGK